MKKSLLSLILIFLCSYAHAGFIPGQTSTFSDGLTIPDDQCANWGDLPDTKACWDTTQAVDNFQFGLEIPRYFSIMDIDHIGNANRDPSGTATNSVLRIYSSDETQANDYIEMFHDQGDGVIENGAGDIEIKPSSGSIGVWGELRIKSSGGSTLFGINASSSTDQVILQTFDGGGNQGIISSNIGDHDHAAQTDPTLFIHSDTDPNTNNTQFGQLSHDKLDFNIQGGSSGGINMRDASGITLQIRASAVSVVNTVLIPGFSNLDPCTASREGAIFYNNLANELCFCDGSNDLRVKDASTACF